MSALDPQAAAAFRVARRRVATAWASITLVAFGLGAMAGAICGSNGLFLGAAGAAGFSILAGGLGLAAGARRAEHSDDAA
jgi:hypothetical protein